MKYMWLMDKSGAQFLINLEEIVCVSPHNKGANYSVSLSDGKGLVIAKEQLDKILEYVTVVNG